MRIPKQERELKKKCLLPDDGAGVNAAITARGAKQLGKAICIGKAVWFKVAIICDDMEIRVHSTASRNPMNIKKTAMA